MSAAVDVVTSPLMSINECVGSTIFSQRNGVRKQGSVISPVLKFTLLYLEGIVFQERFYLCCSTGFSSLVVSVGVKEVDCFASLYQSAESPPLSPVLGYWDKVSLELVP